MRVADFPSTSINFPCSRETFCQLSTTFRDDRRPSVNFCQLFVRLEVLPSTLYAAFRQFPSTFCSAMRPFVNFHQLSVQPEDFCRLAMRAGDLPSYYAKFTCRCETFCQLPSAFRVASRLSVNFCHLFDRPEDLLSISINFQSIRETFHHIPSIFPMAGTPL